MSHDQESSYYEIALTNRQVLTLFVVLLTCLVAAFLSGVWIGQRDRAEGALLASAGEASEESGAAELAELNFFSEAPPLKPTAEAAGPEAPPAEPADPGPADSVGSGQSPLAPAAEPRQSQHRRAPPPPPSAPVSTSPTATAGPVIQVFSTADRAQARRVLQRLDSVGYPVFLLQEDLRGQTMYRVRVGPYREQAEAQRIADELRHQYRLDTWITTQQPG